MEKIWLKSYEAGVNAEIDPAHYTSMIDVVQQSVAKFGDQTAFYSMGKELSYRQIGELSDHFASYLQNVLKLPRGERVAVMMPNLLQYHRRVRHPESRLGGGEHQSALHPARARTPA